MNIAAEHPAVPAAVAFLRTIPDDRFAVLHSLLLSERRLDPEQGAVQLLLAFATFDGNGPGAPWGEPELFDQFFRVGAMLRGYRLAAGTFDELREGCAPELALELAPDTMAAEELDRLILAGHVPAELDWHIAWHAGDRWLMLLPCTATTISELQKWREAAR